MVDIDGSALSLKSNVFFFFFNNIKKQFDFRDNLTVHLHLEHHQFVREELKRSAVELQH